MRDLRGGDRIKILSAKDINVDEKNIGLDGFTYSSE